MTSELSLASSTAKGLGGPAATSLEDDVQCPTCDKKLSRFEMAKHCEQEMERLKEIKSKLSVNLGDDSAAESSSSNGNQTEGRRKPWSVFQKVQKNRQSRMKQRSRKRPSIPEHPCPVCNESFSQDEIHEHAELCLRKSNGPNNDTDEHSNDEDGGGGGEEYEEYEWAGQKRIRVSSLLQGGYAALGIGTNGSSSSSSSSRLNGQDEEDEDLNVDEDDTQIYGPTQYGESDIIPSHILSEHDSDVTSYMRRLITGSSASLAQNVNNTLAKLHSRSLTNHNNNNNSTDTLSPTELRQQLTDTDDQLQPKTPAQYQQIIDSLKAKLNYYEQQQQVPGKYKCLICLDNYHNPTISVACWHIHCETCWLRSLGTKKLCPQCNLITTPKDLRRIYM